MKIISEYFLLFATIAVFVLFGALRPKFLSPTNLFTILASASIVGTMALGAMTIMATGEINFGVGAEATLAAAVVGVTLHLRILPWYIAALILAGFVAVLAALLNSAMTVKIGIPAFIATLAISKINDGIVLRLINGATLYSENWGKSFSFIGTGYIGPIPILAILFVVLSVAMWLFMDKTKLGRHIQAVGENPVACKQVGINVKKVKVTAFLICSLLVALSGIMSCSKTVNVDPLLGSGIMMNAMNAAMLGATFLRPGHFNVQGTIIAAILMTAITNGITFVGAPDFLKDIVKGIILLIAVGYIAVTRKEGLPSVRIG